MAFLAKLASFIGLRQGSRRSTLFALFVFIATLMQAILVVSCNPIVGYGNNFDFIRQSSCTGLWQSYPDRAVAHPEALVNSLVNAGNTPPGMCVRSIDNLFPLIVATIRSAGAKVDFREVSAWKIIAIFSLAGGLLLGVKVPSMRAALTLAFFLIFSDVANLAYANTFYLEFSVICGLYLSLSTTLIFWRSTDRPGAGMAILAVLSLVWLGFSKQQYMPIALVLALLDAAIVFRRWRSVLFPLLLCAFSIATPLAFRSLNPREGLVRTIGYANNTDTFLGAVLPEARDPSAALRILDLPDKCARAIGKNWYTPGLQQQHPCPEVEGVSRVRLLALFLRDPATFIVPMAKELAAVWPLYPNHLGMFERPEDSHKFRALRALSLSSAFLLMPPNVFAVLAFVSIMLWAPLLALLARKSWRKQVLERADSIRTSGAMLVLGSLAGFYAVASSVFGDGYYEASKHAIGLDVGIGFQIAGLCLAMWETAMHRRNRGRAATVASREPPPVRRRRSA